MNYSKSTNHTESFLYDYYEFPFGKIICVVYKNKLSQIIFNSKSIEHADFLNKTTEIHEKLFKQLDEYVAGTRKLFDIPLNPSGTEFQKKVWNTLLKIPYGETHSYKEQTDQIGDKTAIRAVAAANGKNPIPILIPCHRVIGTNGKLTGYAGGLEIKRWLLEHEL